MDYTKQIDYSSLSTYLDCPRKFYFQYVNHLRSSNPNLDLVFGSAWHYGLEQAYKELAADDALSTMEAIITSTKAFNLYWKVEGAPHWPDGDSIFPKSPGHAANMYDEYWSSYLEEDRTKKIIGVEIPFRIKLSDSLPEYIGRIDLAMLKEDQLQIIDHKTCKSISAITLPGFSASLQTDGYLTAGKIYFDRLPMMTYNMAICQKSKIAFERIDIMKRDSSTDRFLSEITDHMADIIVMLNQMEFELNDPASREKSFLPRAFARTPGYACTQYFRRCAYFDLCMLRNNPYLYRNSAPQGYTISEWDPNTHDEKIAQLLEQAKEG